MDKPEISVITCSIDLDMALSKTITSINSQIDVSFESVVILSAEGKRLVDIDLSGSHVISQEPRGIYGAMNLGLLNARGQYCIFLNSGDIFTMANSLSKLFCTLENHEWGYGGIEKTSLKDSVTSIYHFKPYISILHKLGLKYVPHPSVLVNTELAKNFGGFDEKFHVAADQKLLLQFAGKYRPAITEEIITSFSLGGASSTRGWQSIVDDFKKIDRDLNPSGRIRHVVFAFNWKLVSILRSIFQGETPLGRGLLKRILDTVNPCFRR